MDGWKFSNLSDLKAAVADARGEAEREARRAAPAYKSRGTFLVTADGTGSCRPCESGAAVEWRRTWKELREVVEEIERDYPKVTSLSIDGGYDGADNVTDLLAGDYEPWVSEWSITVWTRPAIEATQCAN